MRSWGCSSRSVCILDVPESAVTQFRNFAISQFAISVSPNARPNQIFKGAVLRSSPVKAIRAAMVMMAAAAVVAAAVGGEPERVYMPS